MIVQMDFLNKLKDFGLNSYESKLWTALLSRGVSTAGELSDIANVPRSRSYDVLESLEKKGFVIMKIGKPIKYIAIPPEEAIIRVKKKVKEDADTRTKILDDLKSTDVLKELNILHKQGDDIIDPVDLVANIKGRDSIYANLESMFKRAEKSILLATTEEGLKRKYGLLKSTLEKTSRRGVRIKVIIPATKGGKKNMKEITKIAEVRQGNGFARFCVVDGKELLFMMQDDKGTHSSYETGIWIKKGLFAEAMQNMYESVWKGLKSVKG